MGIFEEWENRATGETFTFCPKHAVVNGRMNPIIITSYGGDKEMEIEYRPTGEGVTLPRIRAQQVTPRGNRPVSIIAIAALFGFALAYHLRRKR